MKILVLLDPVGTATQTAEEEFIEIKNRVLAEIPNAQVEQREMFKPDEIYDGYVIDWGGMSVGNSMLQWIVRYIINEAITYPNRSYWIYSKITRWVIDDLLDELGNHAPTNIYIDFRTFMNSLKQEGR